MIILRPGCKINLGLRIRGRRADGYHCIDSLFYPLPFPRDELRIAENAQGFELICSGDSARNTVRRAWELFAQNTGFAPGLRIILKKRIPMGAGLGGGSADAAAMLLWLNARAPEPLAQADLQAVAAKIGADVPFFLINRPCAVSGIGERLAPVPFPGQGLTLVLVCPKIHVSTHWAYAAWDALAAQKGLTSEKTKAKEQNSTGSRGLVDLRNDLEEPVFAEYPALFRLKRRMLELGAIGAAMSGSGSSIYGIFDSARRAEAAAAELRARLPLVMRLPLRNFGM